MINWQNDPFFYDNEPVQVNHWLNANELIRLNRRNELFVSGENLLNLYPIMIRKNDFVKTNSSDRVMARFPFLVLDAPTQKLIVDKILLLSETTRDYFYKSINKSILEWKEDILRYLSRGTLPFPIFRCCFELEPSLQTLYITPFLHFTSARGETFKMPTELTKELAYLAGMINGDGNLQKYAVRIVDYSIKNIEQLKGMFEEFFAQTGNIVYKTPNSPELVITNLWVVRLFSFLTDQPIGTKKYASLTEPLIFKEEPFRSYYWSGVMDADGSYKNGTISFVSASKIFAQDFLQFLKDNNIKGTFTEREDIASVVYVPSFYRSRFKQLLICLHPEKKLEFASLVHIHSQFTAIFDGYKDDSLINGYFNFRLIQNLSVTGLGEFIRKLRGNLSRHQFAEKCHIGETNLHAIEEGKSSINILHLDEILKAYNLQLMPILSNEKFIRYHIRASDQVKLATKPTEYLSSLLGSLLFHKHCINLPQTAHQLKQELEEYFAITIQDTKITSRILLSFFKTFLKLKIKEDNF